MHFSSQWRKCANRKTGIDWNSHLRNSKRFRLEMHDVTVMQGFSMQSDESRRTFQNYCRNDDSDCCIAILVRFAKADWSLERHLVLCFEDSDWATLSRGRVDYWFVIRRIGLIDVIHSGGFPLNRWFNCRPTVDKSRRTGPARASSSD